MRYSYILLLLLCLSLQTTHGLIMDNESIKTAQGSIKWEQLMSLPGQMNALKNQVRVLQACTVLAAAALIYMKWFKDAETTLDGDTDNALKVIQ